MLGIISPECYEAPSSWTNKYELYTHGVHIY